MKTMQKHSLRLLLLAVVSLVFALPGQAQLTPYTYFNVDWQFNGITGHSFANRASGWGMNFEGGYYVLPDLAVGGFLQYHTNHKYIPRQTLPLTATSALTTDQQHSLFQVPFGLLAHYRFRDDNCQPYVSLKLGANYAKLSSEFNIYEVKDNTWGFYLSPEVGVNVYPWPNSIGFHLAVYYSYATNKGTIFDYHVDNVNNLGFRLGIAF